MKNYEFKIDTKSFNKKIKEIKSELPNFEEQLLKKIGLRLIGKAKKLSPVDTGLLRRSWFIENIKTGQLEIKNNAKYALPVEMGHRTKNGGFVPGKFMLKRALIEIEKQVPKIIENEIKKIIN